MRFVCSLGLLLVAVGLAGQPRRSGPGTGNPDEHLVPWLFLQSDVLVKDRPITLYWFPRSLRETEQSRLMTAESLRIAATRCVGLEIVLPERSEVIQKLGVTAKIPTALVVDREGKVIRRVENVRGVLAPEQVEQMLSKELSALDDRMFRDMTEANADATNGQTTRAIELFKGIWENRCLFPLAGTEAQRLLKNLGVVVQETPTGLTAAPDLQKTPPAPTTTAH